MIKYTTRDSPTHPTSWILSRVSPGQRSRRVSPAGADQRSVGAVVETLLWYYYYCKKHTKNTPLWLCRQHLKQPRIFWQQSDEPFNSHCCKAHRVSTHFAACINLALYLVTMSSWLCGMHQHSAAWLTILKHAGSTLCSMNQAGSPFWHALTAGTPLSICSIKWLTTLQHASSWLNVLQYAPSNIVQHELLLCAALALNIFKCLQTK